MAIGNKPKEAGKKAGEATAEGKPPKEFGKGIREDAKPQRAPLRERPAAMEEPDEEMGLGDLLELAGGAIGGDPEFDRGIYEMLLRTAVEEGNLESARAGFACSASFGIDMSEEAAGLLAIAEARGDTAMSGLLRDVCSGGGIIAVDGLSLAAARGETAEVERLLDAGVDANARSIADEIPLYEAALNGHAEVVAVLIAHGADVNARDYVGTTALMLASLRGHKHVVELLVSAGADVNARDEDGETALMKASRNGHAETARILIGAGATE